jgi:hypothetical protein
MKMSSKILMIVLLLFSFSLPLTDRAYAMAQISLQNNTSFWLYLYIDGNFGCGPVMPSGFCISSVTPGSHVLDARKKGESSAVIMSEAVNIGDGTSPTWTVTIEDPDQALLKKLDGARYVNQGAWPKMKTEDELVIRGTTLVWRNRIIWASQDIATAIARGIGGFRHRTIGTWLEFGQMQIVGREAHHHRVLNNSNVEEFTFTISEDGNSITKKGGNDTYIFNRQ